MADKKQEFKPVEIFKTEIDFDALEKWTDSEKDDLPVVGYMSFYRAIGLLDAAKKYAKEHPDFYLYHLDNILCNFMTNRRIKHFIESNWSVYDIDIDADNHTFWDTKKYPKGKKHYEKKIKDRIKKSLNKDFLTYTPGVDDELGVNEIVLVDYIPIDSEAVDAESESK